MTLTAASASLAQDAGAADARHDESSPPQSASDLPPPSLGTSSAAVVREANRMMQTGEIAQALERYRRVLDEHPDERAVLFNSGLANFQLGDYAAARDAFERASLSDDPALATDALYGIAACDYAEGLGLRGSDPKLGLQKTQRALSGLHDVLSFDSAHEGAADARLKAAALWNQLKQIIEQQPPQQQPSENNDENQDQEDSEQQGGQQSQQNQDQQEQDQPNRDPSQQQPQDENQQPQDQQDPLQAQQQQQAAEQQEAQEEQQQQQQQAEQNKEEQQTAATEDEKEEQTREEALRQLRRLMDRQRLNQQRRREFTPPLPVQRVEKDW